jgi:hypothetical protein
MEVVDSANFDPFGDAPLVEAGVEPDPVERTGENEPAAAGEQVSRTSEAPAEGHSVENPPQGGEDEAAVPPSEAAEEKPAAPDPLPAEVSPERAYEQARYFQAERDKLRDQLEAGASAAAIAEANAALIRRIEQDPDLYNKIKDHLTGPEPAAAREASAAATTPEPPTPPQPPADNYGDDWDRYQADHAQYLKDLAQYTEKVVDSRVSKVENRINAEKAAQDQREQAARDRFAAIERAKNEYGLTDAKAAKFVDDFLPNLARHDAVLVKAFEISEQQQVNNSVEAARQEEARKAAESRQDRSTSQTITGSTGGAPPVEGLIVEEEAPVDPWA